MHYNTWTQLYHYNISFILIFYMWLYINVYTHALMIMWVVNFSKITVGERPSANQCTAPLYSMIHRDNYIIIILVSYWYSICDFTLILHTHAIVIMWVTKFDIITPEQYFMVNMKLVVSIYPKGYICMLKCNSPRAKLEIRCCIGLHRHISPVHSI